MDSVEALTIALAVLEQRASASERRNPHSTWGVQLREAIETLEALHETVGDLATPTLKIEFDDGGQEEGAGEVFQLFVPRGQRHACRRQPAFLAELLGGQNPDDHDEEEWLDEVQIRRVDDVYAEQAGEPEYVRVKRVKVSS